MEAHAAARMAAWGHPLSPISFPASGVHRAIGQWWLALSPTVELVPPSLDPASLWLDLAGPEVATIGGMRVVVTSATGTWAAAYALPTLCVRSFTGPATSPTYPTTST